MLMLASVNSSAKIQRFSFLMTPTSVLDYFIRMSKFVRNCLRCEFGSVQIYFITMIDQMMCH